MRATVDMGGRIMAQKGFVEFEAVRYACAACQLKMRAPDAMIVSLNDGTRALIGEHQQQHFGTGRTPAGGDLPSLIIERAVWNIGVRNKPSHQNPMPRLGPNTIFIDVRANRQFGL